MTRKPRALSPDEERLWQRVAGSAMRLGKKPAGKVPQDIRKGRPRTGKAFAVPEFRIGEKAATAPAENPVPARSVIRVDRKKLARMRRGKVVPDARIDLHGKTAAEGRAALASFLLNAHMEGHRTVLVITGKGREKDGAGPVPERRGILRQLLPQWTSIPPLDQVVLQCVEAHPRHGGSGAFYVCLARCR